LDVETHAGGGGVVGVGAAELAREARRRRFGTTGDGQGGEADDEKQAEAHKAPTTYLAVPAGAGTTSSGFGDWRATCSVTEPWRGRDIPERPCAPMTTTSGWNRRIAFTMASPTEAPPVTNVRVRMAWLSTWAGTSARRLLSISFCRSASTIYWPSAPVASTTQPPRPVSSRYASGMAESPSVEKSVVTRTFRIGASA